MTTRDFSAQGWKPAREDWQRSVQAVRAAGLTCIEARRGWVSEELAAAWDALAPLFDEVEYRAFPREAAVWRRMCSAIQALSRAATADEEPGLASTLDALLTTAVLFAKQAMKDESPF